MFLILLANVASTWAMVGLIWFVQIVHYPLFGLVGQGEFAEYEHRHKILTTRVVLPLMLTELASASALCLWCPEAVSPYVAWIGFGLIALIWLSTIFVQIPAHQSLSKAFSNYHHRILVTSNWIRTVAWSVRGLLVLVMVWQSLPS